MDDQNEIANAGDERVCAYEDGRMIWRSDAVAGDSSGSGIDVTDRFVLGESSDSRFLEWLVWTFASATPVFSVAAWITIAFRRRQPRLAYDAAIAALWPAAGFLILLVLVMVGSFVTALFFINLDEDYLAYRQETEQLVEYHDAYDWDGTPEQLGEVEALEVAFTQMNQSGLHLFEWLGRFTVVILMLIWPVMWIASIVHAQRQWFCDFGQENESDQPERLLISAFGLWAILGWLGAHRFYLGRWVSGLLYLFSLGGFGIGWAVDIFTLRSAVDQKNAVSESTHELAPWASDTRFGLFDFVCRWAFFVIGPSVFVVLCVIFSQAELLFVMLFTLVVCGLFGNMQQTIERLNKLERIPLVRSAVLVIKQLHDFYYENQPRSFWFYLLGPITLPIAWIRSAAFRKETSLYLRFFVTILGAVLINQVRLIPTTYRYHSFSSILIWVVVQIAAALLISWVILTPILTTTYTFNLSGRRRRLRVLSLSALCVACSTGLVAGAITFVNHEPSFVSFTLISTRLNDSAFQERLSHSSRLFLEHYVDRIPKPLDDFYPMASHPELTKRYQDEVLSTLTKRDEAKVFRVFTMDVEGDDPDGAWVGVGMLLAEDQDDEWRTLFAMGPDHKFYSTWDKTLPPRVADDFESASALWNSQYEHRIARRSLDGETEDLTREQMIGSFSLERVNSAPAQFDPQKLNAFQQRHMDQLPAETKTRMAMRFLQAADLVSDATSGDVDLYLERILKSAADRMKVAGDVLQFDDFFVADDAFGYDEKAYQKRLVKPDDAGELLLSYREHLAQVDFTGPVDLETDLKAFVEAKGIKIGQIIHALRVAVTGKAVGFGMFETLDILGKERCLRRIDRTLAQLADN